MNILVVGGAGYIGSMMVRRLTEGGHTAIVLDDLSTGNMKALADSVTFYKGDLGDEALLDSIFNKEKVDIVMHFAAKIQVGESMQHPDIYYRNNVLKVISLLDAMRKNGCDRFIFSSSAAVYGQPEYLPLDENHPLNPMNPYGTTKLMVEIILKDYNHAFSLNSIALRYFNAAGAALDGSMGETQAVKQNLIPIVLDNLEKGRPTTIFGDDWDTHDGTCVRDYIHVEDLVAAHLKAVDYISRQPVCDIINLGTSHGASVKEIVEMVSKVHGKKAESVYGERREGDPATVVASFKKAKKVLGWQPEQSDLETIVKSAYNWHFNRRY